MKLTLQIIYSILLLVIFGCAAAYSNVNKDRTKSVVYITDNINIQRQLSKGSTKYIVKCDIDLKGTGVRLPISSEIIFQSKKISNGTLRLSSHSKIVGNGVVFISHPHRQMMVADGVEDIEVSGFIFNILGNKHSSYESAGVSIKNSCNIIIHHCSFIGDSEGRSGFMGLAMLKVERTDIFNNTFKNVYKPDFWNSKQKNTAWATYLVSLKDAKIYQNIFHKTYSGIKLTGYIENVSVYSNESYDNITDGCDFAGISAKNIIIENNKFENCGDCGIEFKILFYDQWHSNEMQEYYGYDLRTPRYFKDITIRNNIISSWVGLKIWNQYNKSATLAKKTKKLGYDGRSGNVILKDNKLIKTKIGSGNPNSSVGIQVAYNSMKQGFF